MIAVIILKTLIEALFVFLFATVVFDIFHYLFHYFLKSRFHLLRKLGGLHTVHHRFFSVLLKIKNEWAKKNISRHVLIEYSVQTCAILCCGLFLVPTAIVLALLLNTVIFITVCYYRGVDPHHLSYDVLPSYRGGFFVTAEYHALHHVYPHNFFSSYVKVIDWVFGTAQQLNGKRVVMTGANGALGRHMKKRLEKEGALVTSCKFGEDYTYDNYEKLKEPLSTADILLLCHGSKYDHAQQANCDSYVAIIELFRSVRPRGLVPLEIWGVGSEIECHPCFGIKKIKVYAASKRNFARKAREYFQQRDIQYRHLVHSAFISPMGPGLMTANFAAAVTLFLLKRGFKYVPVTYTGFAFLNYFRFLFNK
jgi:sterol desaturase/sphingolipid hydroxylase (fatty acid hydroxylase superfamily)